MVVNRTSVASAITRLTGACRDIEAFVVGLNKEGVYLPKTKAQYDDYRRFMHEVLVQGLVDSGHYAKTEFTISEVGLVSEDPKLSQQRPDLYSLRGATLDLCEVTLTHNVERERNRKAATYVDLLQFLSQNNIEASLSIIAVDLTDPEWQDTMPKISDLHMSILEDLVENLRVIHSDEAYSNFRKDSSGPTAFDMFRFELPRDHLVDLVKQATGCEVKPGTIEKMLELGSYERLDDEEYIRAIANGILNTPYRERPCPRPTATEPTKFLAEWEAYKSAPKTTEKKPRVLQLGAPSVLHERPPRPFEETILELRATNHHGGYLDLIKISLEYANPDEVTRIINLPLSEEQLEKEQMQGPGRKRLLRKKGIAVERKPPTHIGVFPEHVTDLEELMSQLESCKDHRVLELDGIDSDYMGLGLAAQAGKLVDAIESSYTTALLTFYSRLASEITINSMRRRKTRQYVLGWSGFASVYFLIAPGAQLRTESNVEYVKIISLVPPVSNPYVAPYLPVGTHWESEWLSVDTDRLKHWQRAADRVALSLLANTERLVTPELSVLKALDEEIKCKNYTLLALTYLEDKQLTSVTNQTIRYLWMKSLGDKQLGGLMDKFPERVNSIIQSTFLQRAVEASVELCMTPLTELVKLSTVNRDGETGSYDESTTGVIGTLPRLITRGNRVPLAYNLNEIYWCMAYNKDRQNAVQDALSILKKVLKEELKYNKEISRREGIERARYFLGTTTVQSDLKHIRADKPESHYFSYRAVLAGLRAQTRHPENMGSGFTWRLPEKINAILQRNLSEFATFKASIKDICREIDPKDLASVKKLGRRTKAVELIAEILQQEQLVTAMDVVKQFSHDGAKAFRIMIQIFKKGQIGGVREIMILFIKARIMIRITEDLAKLIAKADKREILTKGRDKRLMMRGDYEELMGKFPEGTPIQMVKNSYDMTTWAQKFIPSIFIAISEVNFQEFPAFKDLYRLIFLTHCNKQIEYPPKLVEQWIRHPDIAHKDEGLQLAKEKFLRDGKPFMVNHSNMCQGIPHYSSTILALSCLSLRDLLFKECLQQLGQETKIAWKSRAGSDDKGDIIAIDMSSPLGMSQYYLLEQCHLASERLHSMDLSVKSASGNLLYELNSAFMANLETLSPTIKFSMAACDVIGTTSCTAFVNESYTRIRQMKENGCTSLLTGLAHLMNKRHFENIFDMGVNGSNDPRNLFGPDTTLIPYDFGVYPLYDVDLQDIIGPEYHNYQVVKKLGLNNPVCRLLFTELNRDEVNEMFESEDSVGLFKKDHFGIPQGLVRQLANMRSRLDCDPVALREFFENHPFLLVRGPVTLEETKMVVWSKLFTKGASEALRRTSPAIYIGRLSAFRSAKVWTSIEDSGPEVIDLESMEVTKTCLLNKTTYQGFMEWGLKKATQRPPLTEETLRLLYPQWQSYDVVEHFVSKYGALRTLDKKYSQAVRTWAINTYNYEFSAPLKKILETCFQMSHEAAREDVEEFKKIVGMNLESLEQVTQDCKDRGIRPLDLFYYLNRVMRSASVRRVQVFASGPSTQSLHMSLVNMKRFNHSPGQVMEIEGGIDETTLETEARMDAKVDVLKLYTNLRLMELSGGVLPAGTLVDSCTLNGVPLTSWVETTVRSVKNIRNFDKQTQKVFRFASSQVLPALEFKEKLVSWKSLNYTYVKRQHRKIGPSGLISWHGDLKVLVNYANEVYMLEETSGTKRVVLRTVSELDSLYQSLRDMSKVLGYNFREFFRKRDLYPGDVYLSESGKRLFRCTVPGNSGLKLNLHEDSTFAYKQLKDFDTFSILTEVNHHSGSVSVCLKDWRHRSAEICHFPGTLYHVTVPQDFKLHTACWYKGIDLRWLLKNRDWFYNGRLPVMTSNQTIEFLRGSVNMLEVLGQETETRRKVEQYIETREEVNEEMFSLQQAVTLNEVGEPLVRWYPGDLDSATIGQMMRTAMEQMNEAAFKPLAYTEGRDDETYEHMDWADEVQFEVEARAGQELMDLQGKLGQESVGVDFVRALGTFKPKRKRNFGYISVLQQGTELKSRVLQLFFKDGDVGREDTKQLPLKLKWLSEVTGEYRPLALNLQQEILRHLHRTFGLDPNRVLEIVSNRPAGSGQSLPMFQAYVSGEGEPVTDLFEEIMATVYEEPEYTDSETE